MPNLQWSGRASLMNPARQPSPTTVGTMLVSPTRVIRVYDTQPPTVTILSQDRAKISRQSGRDATVLVFQVDEDVSGYQVRIVPSESSNEMQGTLLESGGPVVAGGQLTITITDDEMVAAGATEGTNGLKIFVQDSAGNWSL